MRANDFRIGFRRPPAAIAALPHTPSAAPGGELTAAQRQYLAGVRRLAKVMDLQWGVGKLRFGADSVIGLIPVVGDGFSALASVYEIWAAYQLKLPSSKLVRMGTNSLLDLLLGLVPFLGDAADLFFKSHARNFRIIEEHLRQMEVAPATPSRRR